MKYRKRKRILVEEKTTRQWIEEDQDGDLGLAMLALIYSLGARFKAELESQTLLQRYQERVILGQGS